MSSIFPAPQKISRRAVLRSLLGLPILGFGAAGISGCVLRAPDEEDWQKGPGLGALAAQQGRLYGAAVQSGQLLDPAFAAALRREVNLLVPENELKWATVHPAPNHFNFRGYSRIAAFARANHMAMRGHTLVWHEANPAWLVPALRSAQKAERLLEQHIRMVLKETAPAIRQWDVVNEAVLPESSRADGLRPSPWLRAMGPNYVPLAFRIAHEADPGLTLVYNDYGMEFSDHGGRRKRRLVLNLLEECVTDGVPVRALGLQSHLGIDRPLAGKEFTSFLEDIRALGLNVYVTELDLDLSHAQGRLDDTIKAAQTYVRAWLDLVQEGASIDELLTWGLSDRYSWRREGWPQAAGVLPLDKNMKRGALWETLRTGWLEA